VRDCFVARDGKVFIGADYSTLELRTLAQCCLWLFGESTLAQHFLAGRDPHMELGAKILGISYDEMVRRYRADDPEAKKARQDAKIANFGFPGGLGPFTFVEYADNFGVKIDLMQARELRQQWFEALPEMRLYFHHIQQLSGNQRHFQLKQLGSGRIRDGVTFTSAANSYFQGLAADGAKAALCAVSRECFLDKSSPLYGSRPVLFIHDEIIIEAPEQSDYRKVAGRLEEVMIEQMMQCVPDVPIEAEATVFRRWSKDAKAVYSDDGRLLVWQHPMDA
jgi:DNA polymerase-1